MSGTYGRPWLNTEKRASDYAAGDLRREASGHAQTKSKAMRIAAKTVNCKAADLRTDSFGGGQKVMLSYKGKSMAEAANAPRSAGFRVKLSGSKQTVTVIFPV